MSKQVVVQIADMKMEKQSGTIITFALGSCIGVTFYEPRIKLAALLHIMLPQALSANEKQVFKFADTGIKETLKRMSILGAKKTSLICKIAGGAKMFETATGDFGNIGQRNIEAVTAALRAEGIAVSARQVGENFARTMYIDAETGKVGVRTIGKPEIFM